MGIKKFALEDLWKQPNSNRLGLICIDVHSIAWRSLWIFEVFFLSETKCELVMGNRVARSTDKPVISGKRGDEHEASEWMMDRGDHSAPENTFSNIVLLGFDLCFIRFLISVNSVDVFIESHWLAWTYVFWCSYKAWTGDGIESGDNHRVLLPQATPIVATGTWFLVVLFF